MVVAPRATSGPVDVVAAMPAPGTVAPVFLISKLSLPSTTTRSPSRKDRNDVVTLGLQDVDDMAADPPGCPYYCNLPRGLHACLVPSGV